MSEQTFWGRLAAILEADERELADDYPLDGGNWDSVAQIATIALIDDEFGVTIPAADLYTCESIGELKAIVHRVQAMAQGA